MDAGEGQSERSKSDRFGWLLGAAGLTGVLVALGYIVRASEGDLLGVSTYDPERAGYVLAAADLIMNAFLSLLDWPSFVALILGAALIAGIEVVRKGNPRFQDSRSLLALSVGCVCVLHIVFFALPLTPISNLLFESVCLDRNFDVPKVYQWRTQAVWKEVVCSKVSGVAIPGCGTRSPQKYQRDLHLNFSAAVLSAVLLWLAGWRILSFKPYLSKEESRWWSTLPWDESRAFLITLLLLTLFDASYQYGKTVKSTTVPLAQVDFDTSAPSSVGNTEASNFLVISDNGTSTILYNTDPARERVWVVRDTALKIDRISSLDDVLKRRIENQARRCSQEVPVQ